MDSKVDKKKSKKSKLVRIFGFKRVRNYFRHKTSEQSQDQTNNVRNYQKENASSSDRKTSVNVSKRRRQKLIVQEPSEPETSILNRPSTSALERARIQATSYPKPDVLSTDISPSTMKTRLSYDLSVLECLICLINGILIKMFDLDRYSFLLLGLLRSCLSRSYLMETFLLHMNIFSCYSVVRTLHYLITFDISLYTILSVILLSCIAIFTYHAQDNKVDYKVVLFWICIGDIIVRGMAINLYCFIVIGLSVLSTPIVFGMYLLWRFMRFLDKKCKGNFSPSQPAPSETILQRIERWFR